MRKVLLLFVTLSFFSCEQNDTIDLLPDVSVNVTVDTNLPQYISLQTPTGWAYITGATAGINGIWVQNTGTGNPNFKAFERACPNNDCNQPMNFDESFKLICQCDKSEYSILDGSPQTAGNSQFAREYRVIVNGSILNITNY